MAIETERLLLRDWRETDIAAAGGWASQMMQYVPSEEEVVLNNTVSVWIALSRNQAALDRLMALSGDDSQYWEILPPTPGFTGWTDDHASILPIINYDGLLPDFGR